MPSKSGAPDSCSRARETSHWTAGPSGPQSTTTTWRASSQLDGGALAPCREIGSEQRGRPELAVARDQIAHVLRGRAHEAGGLQDAREIGAVLVEALEPGVGAGLVEQLVRDGLVAVTQALQAVRDRGVLPLGRGRRDRAAHP